MGATKTLLPEVFIHMLQLLDVLVILKDNDYTLRHWRKNKKQNNKILKKTKKRLNYSVLILSCHYY